MLAGLARRGRLGWLWFTAEGAPEPLALLRGLFGAIAAWQVASFMLRAGLWLSDRGWLHSVCYPLNSTHVFSILKDAGSDAELRYFAGATLLAALCMAVGLCSRLACIATWIGLTSLQARLNPVLDGGDIVAQFMIFYLCFARTGERFAVDRWLGKRAGRAGRATVPLWPQKVIVFQVSLIYLSACAHKLSDVCWLDGSAVYYALHYTDNRNFWMPDFLRQPPFTNALTYGTLVVEASLGVVAWLPRYRRWILMAGVLFHLGLAYSLFIPFFAPAMIASYVAFFRGEDLRRYLPFGPPSS